jgi:hypothetical protein
MGSLSAKLGPAVAFVTSALNLRLGLWVDRPPTRPSKKDVCRKRRRLFRGIEFYREMFGRTRCGAQDETESIHLSDGGHFENLALYELVRRHCRYIIASDCGADPELAFDDLGNAVRRIREDFDVDIELDTAPLIRSEDGYAAQHAVLGTIHYDGIDGIDKGILIYFKPVLTSDEPPDVRQYHRRNPSFPHETTGDQFFDEAQWEAYRRLGIHALRSSFRGIEIPPEGDGRAEELFVKLHRQNREHNWNIDGKTLVFDFT